MKNDLIDLIDKISQKAKDYIENADCTCGEEWETCCWYRLSEKEQIQIAIDDSVYEVFNEH